MARSEERREKDFFAMRGVVVVRPRYFTRAPQVEAHAGRCSHRQVDARYVQAHASAGGCRCGCGGREILIRERLELGLWAGVGDRLLALLTWP